MRWGTGVVAILFVLGGLVMPWASGQEIAWIHHFGVGLIVDPWAVGIAAPPAKPPTVYVAGSTAGVLPAQTGAGDLDIFVRRYQAEGYELWTRQFGSAALDNGLAVAADASGVYIAGQTLGTLPGQERGASGSSQGLQGDAFVHKFDATGVTQWTRQFGTLRSDAAQGLAVHEGFVYVAGWTSGALGREPSAGSVDAFVQELDVNGSVSWTRQFGSSESDWALGLAVHQTGLYIVGQTAGLLPNQVSAGAADAFLAKYDRQGTLLWSRQFGSAAGDTAVGVALDGSGVYVAGWTYGALPGQRHFGKEDAFIRKYDFQGTELWTRQFGIAANDRIGAVAVDIRGVYVAGRTEGIMAGQRLTGLSDVFVRNYAPDGTERGTLQFGTGLYNSVTGLAVDPSGLYLAGCLGEYAGLTVGCGGLVLAFVAKRELTPLTTLPTPSLPPTTTATEVMVVTSPPITTTVTSTPLPEPMQVLPTEAVYGLLGLVLGLGAWLGFLWRRVRRMRVTRGAAK